MSTTPIQTPRTDAVWLSVEGKTWQVSFEAMHDHAELLEKELTAAQRTLSEQAGRIGELEQLAEEVRDNSWRDYRLPRTVMVHAKQWEALMAALHPPPAKPEANTQQENPAKQNRSPERFA